MHAAGVCHRDIRLQNVMLREGERCCVKLIDFASCGPADKLVTRRTTVVPVYAAPELLGHESGNGRGSTPLPEYSGKAVDVWALGVCIHVMLTGAFPFTSEAAVREGKLNAALPQGTPGVDTLLKGMLAADRASRLSSSDVVAHAWLKPQPQQQKIASGSPAAWLRSRAAGNAAAEGAVSDAEPRREEGSEARRRAGQVGGEREPRRLPRARG